MKASEKQIFLPGDLLQIPLWVRKNLLPEVGDGLGMFLGEERNVIFGDMRSEVEYRILIGGECHWLYADEFEALK